MNNNNLILQHWEGPFYPGLSDCQQSVKDYAERIGADYKHVSGYPFSDRLGLTIQKVHFLDPMYDDYDQVLMLDMDVWIKPDAFNCFEEPGNCLIFSKFKEHKHNRTSRLCTNEKPYPSGVYYRFTREERQQLRENIDIDAFVELCNNHAGDEIIMHYLMWSTGLDPVHLPIPYADAAERATEFFHFSGKRRAAAMVPMLANIKRKLGL